MSTSPISGYSSGDDNLTIESNSCEKDVSKVIREPKPNKYHHHEKQEEGKSAETEDESLDKFPDIKEQMYNDKLSQLNALVQELSAGILPEYKEKILKLEASYDERESFINAWYESDVECIEREYLLEKQLAAREFEEKKTELKENLLIELEEKKKIIEQERFSLELTGDSMEYKPVSTRKLRRRGNEPPPLVEKRRKPMTTSLQLLLDDTDAEEDLKLITKGKISKKCLRSTQKDNLRSPFSSELLPTASSSFCSTPEHLSNEPRIENGKLYFDKKWFYKGQSILIECKDGSRFNGDLIIIAGDMIAVRRVPENTRLKITLAQLAHGKYLVKKRN